MATEDADGMKAVYLTNIDLEASHYSNSSTENADSDTEVTADSGSSSESEGHALHPSEPVRWSWVRRRAMIRASLAAVLALFAVLWPVLTFLVNGPCEAKEYSVTAYVVMAYTTIMSLICLRLVINSEMTWWLSSPFLVLLRWHILLDAINVWLFHITLHPLCTFRGFLADVHFFGWLSLVTQMFFWMNKFMGFSIITTHLVMLERAFDRSLETKFLRTLYIPFALGLVTASVFLLVVHIGNGLDWLLFGVVVIELCVVMSTLFVAVLMTRGFLMALRSAHMEMSFGGSRARGASAAVQQLVNKAVRFSKRMVWETPLNLTLVALAFFCHVMWIVSDQRTEENVLGGFDDPPEVIFAVVCMTSLTNCARFGSLLSLVEVSEESTTAQLRRTMTTLVRTGSAASKQSSMSFMESWQTGHKEWDEKTLDLANRAISLRALLEFYGTLGGERMPHFDPAKHTTQDVVRQAIIPLSCGSSHGDCAAAMVLMGSACLPDRMVTHSWSNLFSCLVAAVVADALDQPSYEKVLRDQRLAQSELPALRAELYWKKKLDTKYWICCFAVNQHAGICSSTPRMDPVTQTIPKPCTCSHPKYWSDTAPLRNGQSVRCEMNKFDDMMSCLSAKNHRFGQLIAVDTDFNLFTRAWCVAEIHRAQLMGMPQRMSIYSEANLKEHEGWLQHLKVETMSASNPSDTELILSKIDDKQQFNEELRSLIFDENGLIQACHAGFDKVAMLGAIAQRGATRVVRHRSQPQPTPRDERSEPSRNGGS
ncbi:unnamed protein product [Cladocopium goreaui]|uniref:Uncharacterized protein n=1 Tax=Cladocopium goreaui TaxID=2562237 RepID=A0A9P1DPA1_9DINO|nr:unnamed protein product [Cladocopium goreaui]